MRILYKPFAVVAGVVAARLGRTVFRGLWSKIDDAEPPPPTAVDASAGKVVGAAVLEGAVMAGASALVKRASAKSFHYLTGIYPEKREAE
jgi:hypothetical protein